MTPKVIVLTPEELAEIVRDAAEQGARRGIETGIALQSAKDEWLDRFEAADLLKVSVQAIDKWRTLGAIPYYKIGGSVRLKRSDLMSFEPEF